MKAPIPRHLITLPSNVLDRPTLPQYRAELAGLQRAGRLSAAQVAARTEQAEALQSIELAARRRKAA